MIKRSYLGKRGKPSFRAEEEDGEPPKKKKKKGKKIKRGHKAKGPNKSKKGKEPNNNNGSSNNSGSNSRKWKPKGNQGNTGESLVPTLSFVDSFNAGLLSTDAIARVASVGLDVSSSVELAGRPPSGRISCCLPAWELVTNDKWVLDIIKEGYKVSFKSLPDVPSFAPNPPTDAAGEAVLDTEVAAMLEKHAIRQVPGNDDG